MSSDASDAAAQLRSAPQLHIIELSDSLKPSSATNGSKRDSNVSEASADAFDNPTPAGLATELTHYKELFSKLRFSYVEQVTKEKFLRAITDNPPLFVEHNENVELEARLVEEKANLKAKKEEVASLVEELEKKGRDLARRHESVRLRTAELESLPAEIETLQSTVSQLRESQQPQSTNPSLTLPLPETQALLSQRENELASLDAQLATLQASLPRKTRELERLENELRPMEVQKQNVVAQAKEARRRREQGEQGMGDELEERGRWLRASEEGLRGMLELGA